MRSLSRSLFCVSFVLFLGCGGGGAQSTVDQTPPGRAVLAPNARVLDEATVGALSSVDEEGIWRFPKSTPGVQDLAAGEVLITGPGPLLPYGSLVWIEAIEEGADDVALHTRPAALTEAFEELVVHLETTLDTDDPEGKLRQELGKGISQRAQPLGLTLPFHLSTESDGGANKLDLQGSFALDPSFSLKLDLDITEFDLKELSMEFGAKESFAADLLGKGNQPIEERITLGQIWFTPIILMLPIPAPPGIVPVVLTPRLSIVAGVEGRIEGELSASVRQSASFSAGLGYRDGRFQAFSSSDSSFENEQPEYHGNANVKASAGPQLAVLLYGAVGPFAGVDAFVDLHATLQGPPPCATGVLDAGLTGKVGVDFIAKYSTVLFDKRFPLAAFDGCTQDPNAPRPAITWARSLGRAGSQGDIAKAVVQAHDGTYFVVGDSGLFDGVPAFGAATWALRLDALGNVVWQRAFERSASLGLVQGAQEVPGGFLVAGTTGVMMLDSGGNLVWIRAIQSDTPMEIASISAHPDGSFLLAGRHPIRKVAWAMKLGPEGEVRWSRRYGGEVLSRVRATADGGAILLGNGGTSPKLYKVDPDGGLEWQRSINNTFDTRGGEGDPQYATSDEYAFDLTEKPGGGYVVAGRGYSNFPLPEPGPAGFYAPTVFELAPDGELTAATIHRAPAEGSFGAAFAVGVRESGGVVIVGRHVAADADQLKREDLLIIQSNTFDALGGPGNDGVYAGNLDGLSQGMPLAMTDDGGAVVLATSNSFAAADQFWVVKLNRTAGIDTPFRRRIAGNSYENEHARSTETFTSSSELPATSEAISAALRSESTPLVIGRQTP